MFFRKSLLFFRSDEVIEKLGNLSTIKYVTEKVDGALSFRVKSNEYFTIPLKSGVNAIRIKSFIPYSHPGFFPHLPWM